MSVTKLLSEGPWYVGDDPIVDFSVTRNGAAYDLTNCVVRFVVTNNQGHGFTLASDGVSPKVMITVPATLGTGTIDLGGRMEVTGSFQYRAEVIEMSGRQHTFDADSYKVL